MNKGPAKVGSVSLFQGVNMVNDGVVYPTVENGVLTTVAYVDGQVIVSEDNGNIRIMDEDLKTLKILTGSLHLPRSEMSDSQNSQLLENVSYSIKLTVAEPMVSTLRIQIN